MSGETTPSWKSGYINIKQSTRVKPRKLKSWRRQWAVLTQLTNLSNEESVAKLDLYDSEKKWRGNSSDKVTFYLEHVTQVRPVRSKKHQHAFEVVEKLPLLVFSGETEFESFCWVLALQQIFTPDQIGANSETFPVIVNKNQDSDKWSLSGNYSLVVSPASLQLNGQAEVAVIKWDLSTLARFHVEKSQTLGQMDSIVIECGPNSVTGPSCFKFLSQDVPPILATIRQAISWALAIKQSSKITQPSRHRSLSATVSEKSFLRLLNSPSAAVPIPVRRSDSGSSSSATTTGSPSVHTRLSGSPASLVTAAQFSTHLGSFTEEHEISHVPLASEPVVTCIEPFLLGGDNIYQRRRSFSQPYSKNKSGYTEIQDLKVEHTGGSRRNTICGEAPSFDFDRMRSVSVVYASMNVISPHINDTFRDENDEKLDMDSAISSMVLSTTDEDRVSLVSAEDIACKGLPQRRSSSTPDLQAFWKANSVSSRYENVYEELDELRASVQKLSQKQETPPELPARPTSFRGFKSIPGRKQSRLKWQRNLSCGDESKSDHLNTSQIPQLTSNSDPKPRQTSRRQPVTETPKMNTILFGFRKNNDKLCDINDINAIIMEVQNTKRRRSSDITPVSSNQLTHTYPDGMRTGSLPRFGRQMLPPTEVLVNIQESLDIFNTPNILQSLPEKDTPQPEC